MYHPRSFCSGAPHLFFILSRLHPTFLPSALPPAGPQAAGERPGLTTGGAGEQNKRYRTAFPLFAFPRSAGPRQGRDERPCAAASGLGRALKIQIESNRPAPPPFYFSFTAIIPRL